jgi:hypothetical protein
VVENNLIEKRATSDETLISKKDETMVVMWLIVVILCLLIASGSALLALRIQYEVIEQRHLEREAWQQAQEGRQRTWEVRQGKHILEAEKKLADQIKDVRKEWSDWKIQTEQDQQIRKNRQDQEEEIARLPHVEDLELPSQLQNLREGAGRWRPASLYRADLRGRDFSHRYMGKADLREAQLTNANFYMADLSEACLTQANLENANLIGANLSGADLRGANLSGANLLVADLHNAILHGATLRDMHNFSLEQLRAAIYDKTTSIDNELDLTFARLPVVQTPVIRTQALLAENNYRHKQDHLTRPDAHKAIDNKLQGQKTANDEMLASLTQVSASSEEIPATPALQETNEPEQLSEKLPDSAIIQTDVPTTEAPVEMLSVDEEPIETPLLDNTTPESIPADEAPIEAPLVEETQSPDLAADIPAADKRELSHNNIIQLPMRAGKAGYEQNSEQPANAPRSSGRKGRGSASQTGQHSSLDYKKGKNRQAKAN